MTTLFISHSSNDERWAKSVHKQLETAGYQTFLASDPDRGIQAGAKWERTLYQRLRQSRGVIVLCSADWLASPWCIAEAMLSRERGKPIFIVTASNVVDGRQIKDAQAGSKAPCLPDFLKDTQIISLREMTMQQAFDRLVRGLQEEGLRRRDYPLPKRPYPGLDPFQESDAAVLFGRDDEIAEIDELFRQHRRSHDKGFVVVLGASGCGKSSLVRAGMLPRLKRASATDGSTRAWVIPPPFMAGKGRDGLTHSLLEATRPAGQPAAEIRLPGEASDFALIRSRLNTVDELRELCNELLAVRRSPEGSVLLVMDQLEEVFATPEHSEARATLKLLLEASADVSGPVMVLATMRSDFLNAFQLFEGAAERYEKVTLDPMPRSRIPHVIDGPAALFGLELEPRLMRRIVDETAYEDALPLLSFTLEKLYAKCADQETLTHEAYEQLGGVSGAIRQSADRILASSGYAGLPGDDTRIRDLRVAFASLTQIGDEGQFTRRLARWSDLPPSSHGVLNRFIAQRLLVSDLERGEHVISVAHEALFRIWDTLRDWLRQDRKALFLREQIEEAAKDWDGEGRDESRVWSDRRIVDAVHDISRTGVQLGKNPLVLAFLGPTRVEELAALPALGETDDMGKGSGRYSESWSLPLSHEARASVGVRLALLGDPRPGIGLRADGLPDIDWCRVDGGQAVLEIGASPGNPNAECVETVAAHVEAFAIGRYPITIDQFRAFIRDCYRDGQWRLPAGFRCHLPHAGPPRPRARYGNHPADSVSWWDAVAFCHWLSVREGCEIRLPTEFEWQIAATSGEQERVYPWSSAWDAEHEPWRANTGDSGLNRPTAVGMYPAGASPSGVLDMAGTVWEWCQNIFDDPAQTAMVSLEKSKRVLRGGSWVNHRDHARCRNRLSYDPTLRHDNIGFRVVRSLTSGVATLKTV